MKSGHRFTVSRGIGYVAQIEVFEVQAKQAAGRVNPSVSKGPVRAGDDATSTMAPR